MKPFQFQPLHCLLSGFTALAFLASLLAPTAAVYAGVDDPEDLQKNIGKSLVAGVDFEIVEKSSSGLLSLGAMWLKRGDALFSEKSYPEALEFYKKAVKKGTSGAKEKLQEALIHLVKKGDDLYLDKKAEEAFIFYTQVVVYENEEAKERIAELGVELGDSYAAKGNQAEALKYYEQAAFYGNEEGKSRLSKLKSARKLNETVSLPNLPVWSQPPDILLEKQDVWFTSGNFSRALKIYSKAAFGGDAGAQVKLRLTAKQMIQVLSAEGENNPRSKVLALFEPEGREKTALDLTGNRIDLAGVAALVSILPQTKLVTLYLSNNQIGDAGLKILETVFSQIKITELYLNESHIGAEGVKVLVKNMNLKVLDLGRNDIGDEEAKILAQNIIFEKLWLNGNNIGAEGVTFLAENRTLKVLGLSENKIDDAGAEALSKNRTLMELDLSGNKIGDVGTKALVGWLYRTQLQSLNLRNNDLSKGLKHRLYDNICINAKEEAVTIQTL
jgi:Ran GTPase-activating protein (RanGAP) involved in mRNA processing and transport